MATFRINFGYKSPKNFLRSGSLIINAKDLKEAVKLAQEQLKREHDWHQITSSRELDSTASML